MILIETKPGISARRNWLSKLWEVQLPTVICAVAVVTCIVARVW